MAVITTPEAFNNLRIGLSDAVKAVLSPAPRLSMDEWAEQYLYIPNGAFPGRFSLTLTPWLRGILQAISNPLVRDVVLAMPSQVGKTVTLLVALGYYVHQAPSDILLVQPKIDAAKEFSRERVEPLFLHTPVLRVLYNDRDPLQHKDFLSGALLNLVGSNSENDLSSRACKVLLLDEVDRYEVSTDGKGDPVSLAKQRQATYWDRKTVMASTPGSRGASHIWPAWEASNMAVWMVPCPKCGGLQELEWGQNSEQGNTPFGLKWEKHNSVHRPETAKYLCKFKTGGDHYFSWQDMHPSQQLGQWVVTNPSSTVSGFHMTGLNSLMPGADWSQLASRYIIAAKQKSEGNSEPIKAFKNTVLAELWDDEAERLKEDEIGNRRATYDAEVPTGVNLLVAAVDVQEKYLEWAVWGFGVGDEAWQIKAGEIMQSPREEQAWVTLTATLNGTFTKANGHKVHLNAVAIDTGYGNLRPQTLKWIDNYSGPIAKSNVIGIRGQGGHDIALIRRNRPPKNGEFTPWIIGTDVAKDLIFARFSPDMMPGPGYIHLWSDLMDDKVKHFTSETRTLTKRNGKLVWSYHKTRRNEQLDLLVYCLALTRKWGEKAWARMKAPIAQPLVEGDDVPEAPAETDEKKEVIPVPYPIPRPTNPIRQSHGITIADGRKLPFGFNQRKPFGRF